MPVGVIVLDFSKAFDTFSQSSFLEKKSRTHLDKSIIHWVSNWRMGWAQRVIVNRVIAGCWPVTSKVAQGSILGPVLFNVFINYLDAGIKCILNKFANDTKVGVTVDSSRTENSHRDMRIDSRLGWSPIIKNLTKASSEFFMWDGVILIIHPNCGMRGWRAAQWKDTWEFGLMVSQIRVSKVSWQLKWLTVPWHASGRQSRDMTVPLYSAVVWPHLELWV